MIDKDKKCIFDKSAIRFIIVGGFCTLIDFIIYMCLANIIGTIIGKITSMVCSMSVNYFLNKFWSFSAKEGNDKVELLKFIVTQIINITTNVSINTVVLYIFHEKVTAFVVATGVAMMVNYILQRLWVFKKKEADN